MKKNLIILVIMVCLIPLKASAQKADWQPEVKFFKIVDSVTGGVWYTLAARYASEIQKTIPQLVASSGVGGTGMNCVTVSKKEAQIGMDYAYGIYEAYNGLGNFKTPLKDIRFLGSFAPSPFQIVVLRSSNIQKITDLKNKRVAVGKKGGASALDSLAFLEAFGLKEDHIRKSGGLVEYLVLGSATEAFRDGHVDAIMLGAPAPFPSFSELNTLQKIRILSFTDEEIKTLKKHPRLKGRDAMEIPKGTYDGQTEDIRTVGDAHSMIVHKDLSDELVYRATKILFETPSMQELYKTNPQAMKIQHALTGCEIPVHPGALRYYKEKGVDISRVQ